MAMNRVQFQRGLSMTEFMDQYGTDAQCEAALVTMRWPSGFACPVCGGPASCSFRARGAAVRAVRLVPPPMQHHQRHDLRVNQVSVDALVPGHAPADPGQEQRLGPRAQAPSGRVVPHSLAGQAQADGGDAAARGQPPVHGARGDYNAYLGGERSGGKTGRGSENKVPCIAAVQTTEDGKPVVACFTQAPFTKEAVEEFAAKSLARPLTVVSDGLGCFTAAESAGVHERIVTGGGKASVKLPQFQAVNTVLSNLKIAMAGTYHAIKFENYAHRYLAEVQYRFNRRFDLRSILRRLMRVAAATRPQNRGFIREAEVGC